MSGAFCNRCKLQPLQEQLVWLLVFDACRTHGKKQKVTLNQFFLA